MRHQKRSKTIFKNFVFIILEPTADMSGAFNNKTVWNLHLFGIKSKQKVYFDSTLPMAY